MHMWMYPTMTRTAMRCSIAREPRGSALCWRSTTGRKIVEKLGLAAVPYAEAHDWIYAAAGIHPHEARHATDEHYAELDPAWRVETLA